MPRRPRQIAMPSDMQVEDLRGSGIEDSTNKNYDWWFSRFANWCADHDRPSLPADPDTLSLYLTKQCSIWGHAGLSHTRSAVRWRHIVAGYEDPGADLMVRRLMQTLRRRFGSDPEKKPALTSNMALQALETQEGRNDVHDDIWLRLRTIVLISWASQMRLGSLSTLGVAVKFNSDGSAVVPTIDANGAECAPVTVAARGDDLCPVAALRQWLPKIHPDATRLFQTGPTASAATMRGQTLPRLAAGNLSGALYAAVHQCASTSGATLPMKRYAGDGLTANELRTALDTSNLLRT